MIIYCVYFMIHYFLSVKIHGAHIFSLFKLMLYAILLIIIAAVSLMLKDYMVARWGMLIVVVVIGTFWANKEFGILSLLLKKRNL